MLSSDEGVDDVFFDSADWLSSEESAVAKDESRCWRSEFEVWMKEPRSVKERRKIFLSEMGLGEFAPVNEMIEMERITECSEAVLSSAQGTEENVGCKRETNCEANCMVDESEVDDMTELSVALEGESIELWPSVGESQLEVSKDASEKVKKWWKHLVSVRRRREDTTTAGVAKANSDKPKMKKIKMKQNQKKFTEFTALYTGQEIQAHNGYIWTMKFSADGQYLASGGEDGVVRIWRVTSEDASCKSFIDEGNFGSMVREGKTMFGKKKYSHVPVVVPNKVFRIEKSPLQEFHGHTSAVLDLAWSNSNYLLSCSMDKTVRLWQVGCDKCINIFHHSNYVTCIQFNPNDDNYFISGSIDGKVRIWGVSKERVVNWTYVRDVISAICYRPNGKGFVVGTVTGTCRFYEASGNDLELEAEIHFPDGKKSSGNKITGIQEESHKIMITSEDSKLRILDGFEVIHKFKGLSKSGSQMSASFTTTGKHIISVGEDCRVYVWSYDDLCFPSSKHTKSIRSCEHFIAEGVSVAVQWSGMGADHRSLSSLQSCSQRWDNLESSSWNRDAERFSLGRWFSIEGSCRAPATWPEEKLPLWETAEDLYSQYQQHHHQQQCQSNLYDLAAMSETWGLVIVTAGCDGMIKTFHNYGLPVRL
ncbi:uncharacterized WD repeat-containing protein C3H5.08c-like isoform X2 [Mangifera indica]|uniref:uncharacterized WD repeat-containing protein C3H5.08c-like isoform X2 n=1 Tax=Mangifera indica TaxID=29780 RepID=UPI001CF9D406|nr:uncharacterized WD repeat-containing protein C3H5.08c-like isoform X2 [Mangifera indica]